MSEQASVGSVIVFWTVLLVIAYCIVNKTLTSTKPNTVGGAFIELNETIDGNR